MIFVSVGTQLPFERLVKAMDNWAKANPAIDVIAQIGTTKYLPKSMSFEDKLSPSRYSEIFKMAEIVVSHAGMGTIISGLENRKPMVLMPRRYELLEHRNNHQLSTAERFKSFDLVNIADSEVSLYTKIADCMHNNESAPNVLDFTTSQKLIDRIDTFIKSNSP